MSLSFLLRRAIANPDRVLPYVGLNVKKSLRLLRDGRVHELAGYLSELLTSENSYLDAIRAGSDSQLIEREVRGQSMLVDATDPGISRTLLAYGTHERLSTDAFVDALEDLAVDTRGRVTMLDIGANIGYFTLISADVFGTRGRIHAFEPHPKNAELLGENVAHNEYDGVVDMHQCAVGAENETVTLYLHDRANCHTTWNSSRKGSERPAAVGFEFGSVPDQGDIVVEQVCLDEWLSVEEISPESIDVVRMDVEGYEFEIFRGMRSVLESSSPLVLHVELHPRRLSERELDEIVTHLDGNGFEILSAVASNEVAGIPPQAKWYGRPLDIEDFEELRRLLINEGWWIEVVARR